MGCDGGTIPRRDELVKVKKKPEAPDNKDFKLVHLWHYCHLSQQMLQAPIVMCGLGYVYNKIALIEGLLNRETLPESVRHIRSLKDVKNLNLTPNPEYKANDNKRKGEDSQTAPYTCPVTGMEMSGKYSFIGLWSCGCVFSQRALKEIKMKTCNKCQAPFTDEDIVILNGNVEDIKLMKRNMEIRQEKNKRKKVITAVTESDKPSFEPESQPSSSISVLKPANMNTMGQPITKRKASNVSKTKSKNARHNYSVAKDPQATDVYKSLFTTHQSEQQQTRAHWITYNPFYN